jgi:hypothetical protein
VAKTISDSDFDELWNCIVMITTRLHEARNFDKATGEGLSRAEQEAKTAKQIMERIKGASQA